MSNNVRVHLLEISERERVRGREMEGGREWIRQKSHSHIAAVNHMDNLGDNKDGAADSGLS